jgi:hypothetical protein
MGAEVHFSIPLLLPMKSEISNQLIALLAEKTEASDSDKKALAHIIIGRTHCMIKCTLEFRRSTETNISSVRKVTSHLNSLILSPLQECSRPAWNSTISRTLVEAT